MVSSWVWGCHWLLSTRAAWPSSAVSCWAWGSLSLIPIHQRSLAVYSGEVLAVEMSQEIAWHQAYLTLAVSCWLWDCHQQLLYSRAVWPSTVVRNLMIAVLWPSTVVRNLMIAVLLVLSDHPCWHFGICADNARLSRCLHEVHYTMLAWAVTYRECAEYGTLCQLCDSSLFTKGLLNHCLTICRLNLYCVSPTLIW